MNREYARIAIVMATYNPNLRMISEQIESIKNQSVKDWNCYISDDASSNNWISEVHPELDDRFKLKVWGNRVGAYRNFERGLTFLKDESFVFFCDQDDIWATNKIEVTLSHFKSGVSLVHCDAHVVNMEGKTLHQSLHKTEKRETRKYSIPGLIFKNSITGCTAAATRRVIDNSLPFPEIGGIQHDLWIALNAIKFGSIGYISRPLMEYRQHSNNVVGLNESSFLNEFMNPRRAAKAYLIKSQLSRIFLPDLKIKRRILLSSVIYPKDLSFRQFLYGINYFLGKCIVTIHDVSAHIRIYKKNQSAHLVKLLSKIKRRFANRLISLRRLNNMMQLMLYLLKNREFRINALKKMEAIVSIGKKSDAAPNISFKLPQLTPIGYEVVQRDCSSLILFVPSLNKEDIYGGLATAIKLGCKLAEHVEVRICVTDKPIAPFSKELIDEICHGLNLEKDSFSRMLSNIEYQRVAFSHKDFFLATAWWTMAKAKQILEVENISSVGTFYLVQDFEPLFYAASDLYAAALSTYALSDVLIVNSESLMKYISNLLPFEDKKIVVLEPQYLMSQLPVRKIASPKVGPIKLLVYGRPSVARNLFGTLIASLERATQHLPNTSFEIISVGEYHEPITLKSGHVVKSLGKLNVDDYLQLLSRADLGISLMLSPHPSYPPLEMASAGMQVITNDFFGYKKNLENRFSNLHVVAPDEKEISGKLISLITSTEADRKIRESGAPFEISIDKVALYLLDEIHRKNAV